MLNVLKYLFRFIVFNNIWIALCAVSALNTTRWFLGIPLTIDALTFFIFFSTFFEYNFHKYSWPFNSKRPSVFLNELFSSVISRVLKICIAVGFIGTIVSFAFLDKIIMPAVFISSLFTLAYSIPLIKWNNKFVRLREITYFKVFLVAIIWCILTVIIPVMNFPGHITTIEVAIIFIRRFLFIYAITIPFEIRGMEIEKSRGNENLSLIFGVKKMKITGLVFMLLFCILSAVQENYLAFNIISRQYIFLPLMLSAITAGLLILFYSSKRSEWYNKFWVDGMMVLQLLLLLVFNSGDLI